MQLTQLLMQAQCCWPPSYGAWAGATRCLCTDCCHTSTCTTVQPTSVAAKQGIAEHGTAEDGTAEDGTAEHGTAEDGTAEHGTAEDGTAEHGTAEHGTAEHSTAEHGTAEHGKPGDAALLGPISLGKKVTPVHATSSCKQGRPLVLPKAVWHENWQAGARCLLGWLTRKEWCTHACQTAAP